MKLTNRQTAAILFALRDLQQTTLDILADELDYGEHAVGAPLTAAELDSLCEAINCGTAIL